MSLQFAGRILYAVPMACFGIIHFMEPETLTGLVPVPGGIIWVYVTGAGFLAAAAAIATGRKAALASLLLGIMLLIFVLIIHTELFLTTYVTARNPWDTIRGAIPDFLKDTALAGAAFVISSTFAASNAKDVGST